MTNNQHGQVPEALIDLIDAYAETRHRYGRIHNAKTEAARNAVIEALSGVQALSAAPANHNASRALQGLDFIMRVYEPCMGKPAPDEEMATIVEATKRLLLGWWGEHRDTVRAMLAASPTPPAEQAQPGAVGRTGCTAGTDEECTRRGCATSCPAQQAAPKAAPVTQQAGYAEVIECGNSYAKVKLKGEAFGSTKVGDIFYTAPQQEATKAAPGEQNTVPAERLEQAYREGWAACRDAETIGEEAEDWAFGNSTANSRMIDAQQAAPKQGAQEPTTVDKKTMELAESVGLIGPASRVGDLHAAIQRFHDLICVNATIKAAVMAAEAIGKQQAAHQQEAQEPVAYVHVPHYTVEGKVRPVVSFEKYQQDYDDGIYSTRIPLYTAPQPAPAPLSEMPYEKRKAIQEGEQISASDAWFKARHEMLDTVDRRNVFRAGFDRGWSAAIAAQGGK